MPVGWHVNPSALTSPRCSNDPNVCTPPSCGSTQLCPAVPFHAGGIFTLSDCSAHLTAQVLIGYSTGGGAGAPGTYWKLQSSLGNGWGEGGFMRLQMGQEGTPGECGMYTYAVAPLEAGILYGELC